MTIEFLTSDVKLQGFFFLCVCVSKIIITWLFINATFRKRMWDDFGHCNCSIFSRGKGYDTMPRTTVTVWEVPVKRWSKLVVLTVHAGGQWSVEFSSRWDYSLRRLSLSEWSTGCSLSGQGKIADWSQSSWWWSWRCPYRMTVPLSWVVEIVGRFFFFFFFVII